MRFPFLLLLLTLLALPVEALAHAQLRGSDPGEGAVIATSPTHITLTFNEPVSPLVLRRIAPDGTARDMDGSAANEVLTIPLPTTLERGTHLLSWRVVSSDGHPVGGTLTFHVGVASSVSPTETASSSGAARATAFLRFALTASLVIVVGAAVFAALVQRGPLGPTITRAAQGAGVLTLPFGVALLGAQGLDLLALPAAALLTLAPWQAVLAAPLLLTVGFTLSAALVSLVALKTHPSSSRAAVLLAWVLAAASFAASGHAAAAEPRWLTLPAMWIHAAALIFWMGALLPLLAALPQNGAPLFVRRFSSLAAPLVALLLASGAVLTWVQTAGDLSALRETSYGALFAAKLALVVVLLALAARNRLVLTPALAASGQTGRHRLGRAIRVEVVVGLLVLALASGFRLTSPPRAMAPPSAPLALHIHGDRAMVDIMLSPGRVGPVDLVLGFQTVDFEALVPKEVDLTFAMPGAGIEPIRIDVRPDSTGLWSAGPITLPVAGEWHLSLRLLISDFESLSFEQTFTLDP
ncbi:MAG: copper resistance protein CopC [Pseudomonadota bacterium]